MKEYVYHTKTTLLEISLVVLYIETTKILQKIH